MKQSEIFRENGQYLESLTGQLPRDPAVLRLTIIGRPFAGRTVTRSSGQTAWLGSSSIAKFLAIIASTIVASCNTKADPMQVRGPVPNGS
jgi:hypothetical protein